VGNPDFLPPANINLLRRKTFAAPTPGWSVVALGAVLLASVCLPARASAPCDENRLPDSFYLARLLNGSDLLDSAAHQMANGGLLLLDTPRRSAGDGEGHASLNESPAKPAVSDSHIGSRLALAFKASTLGLGADLGVRLAHPLNLRFGFSGFNYSRTVADGDVSYLGTLHLRSLETLVDWFPGSRGFHLSPGLLLYNANRVTANALIPTGRTLTSGTEVFISNPQNPITGSANSSLRKIAPMILFGFGNLVPRSRRFSFSSDFGVVFQGQPSTSFALLGSACDTAGVHCRDIAHDASIAADVRSGEQTMRDDLSVMKYYPVISVAFGYHF
jgi:hypothetical protein